MTDVELRRLAEAATPGPWSYKAPPIEGTCHAIVAGDHNYLMTDTGYSQRASWAQRQQDARYIAAANPATVLALLDRIDAVRALHYCFNDAYPYDGDWCLECRQPWPLPDHPVVGRQDVTPTSATRAYDCGHVCCGDPEDTAHRHPVNPFDCPDCPDPR